MPAVDQICMALTCGVKEAFAQEDIAAAISQGVDGAMPYGDMIVGAIFDGVKAAMRERGTRVK